MRHFTAKLIIALSIAMLIEIEASAQTLDGRIYSSKEYGSGWIDLRNVTDFMEGDTLFIRIGGTAKTVLVRLLPQGVDPGTPAGIVDGARKVPVDRILRVILDSDYARTAQISVHGMDAWNLIREEGNGPATLLSVVRKKVRP